MLWYVATPYSKYADGLVAAFEHASAASADLMRQGLAVYSPIAHTHPIAIHGNIDPLDHEIWMALDEHMMRVAYGLIVLEMPGWDVSKGIAMEIEFFKNHNKPIRHFAWPELTERPQ